MKLKVSIISRRNSAKQYTTTLNLHLTLARLIASLLFAAGFFLGQKRKHLEQLYFYHLVHLKKSRAHVSYALFIHQGFPDELSFRFLLIWSISEAQWFVFYLKGNQGKRKFAIPVKLINSLHLNCQCSYVVSVGSSVLLVCQICSKSQMYAKFCFVIRFHFLCLSRLERHFYPAVKKAIRENAGQQFFLSVQHRFTNVLDRLADCPLPNQTGKLIFFDK